MTAKDANKALMDFLGVDSNSGAIKVEVIAMPNHYPTVIITRLLDDPTWKTETRMFELVPYSKSL
jgi:hypothetical protein